MGYKNDQVDMLNIKPQDETLRLKTIILELRKEIKLLVDELKRKNIID